MLIPFVIWGFLAMFVVVMIIVEFFSKNIDENDKSQEESNKIKK